MPKLGLSRIKLKKNWFFLWNLSSIKCKHDPALKVCQSNDLENQIHKLSWQENRQQKYVYIKPFA